MVRRYWFRRWFARAPWWAQFPTVLASWLVLFGGYLVLHSGWRTAVLLGGISGVLLAGIVTVFTARWRRGRTAAEIDAAAIAQGILVRGGRVPKDPAVRAALRRELPRFRRGRPFDRRFDELQRQLDEEP